VNRVDDALHDGLLEEVLSDDWLRLYDEILFFFELFGAVRVDF